MPDLLGQDATNPTDVEGRNVDYLGRSSPTSVMGQLALPAAGGVGAAPSASPIATTTTGKRAATAQETKTDPSTLTLVQRALAELGLLEKGASAASDLAGAGGAAEAGDQVSRDAAAANAATDTGAAADVGALTKLGQFFPYIMAALSAGTSVAQLASNPNLSDEEKAALATLDAAGAGLSAVFPAAGPFIGGFPGVDDGRGGLIGAISQLFRPHIPHDVREAKNVSGIVNTINDTFGGRIRAATTPEELYAAFGAERTKNFKDDLGPILFGGGTGKSPDIGTPEGQAAFMKALEGSDPGSIAFHWQAGIAPGKLTRIDQGLDTLVREQEALIRAASAGDPAAQMELTKRKAAYQAEQTANHAPLTQEQQDRMTADQNAATQAAFAGSGP